MCELLGMSANVPIDICFSFAGLRQRGGGIGPHRDGWGVAFYEGAGVRCFHDPEPCHESAIARLIESYPIRSETVICHVRQANVGGVCLANTHPFTRELWGTYWTFAHNGQLADFTPQAGPFQPVGTTDSESMFCDLLNRLRARYTFQPPLDELVAFIAKACEGYATKGVCNLLISNGAWLFSLCTSRLASITRMSPFGPARLSDRELEVDFLQHTTPSDRVTLIATAPLTSNEQWDLYQPGEWRLWDRGQAVRYGRIAVPDRATGGERIPNG
jgi:predicted glutamine amidotransferase